MSRLVTWAGSGVILLLLAACGGSTRTVDTEPSDQPTPSVFAAPSPTATTSSASPSVEPTEQTTAPSPSPAVEPADLRLTRDFVAFATRPSAKTAQKVPFAGEVQLGLGRDLRATLDRDDAPQGSAWVLKAKYFRGYTGPFSALEPIERHADGAGSTSVRSRGGAFTVSVGDHPHCASPPVLPPRGLEDTRRVSVQPSESSLDSCLSWFTVDLFMTDGGEIAAVTLDLWEP